MFNMKIEKQMNIKDRTILLGVPNFYEIPKEVNVDKKIFKVIGISSGVKPPYISLEIESTELNLEGKQLSA